MEQANNLLSFRSDLNLNKRQMAAILEVHEGNYGKMERGQEKIGTSVLFRFHLKYPEININWWSLNEGEKYSSDYRGFTPKNDFRERIIEIALPALINSHTTINEKLDIKEIAKINVQLSNAIIDELKRSI